MPHSGGGGSHSGGSHSSSHSGGGGSHSGGGSGRSYRHSDIAVQEDRGLCILITRIIPKR